MLVEGDTAGGVLLGARKLSLGLEAGERRPPTAGNASRSGFEYQVDTGTEHFARRLQLEGGLFLGRMISD